MKKSSLERQRHGESGQEKVNFNILFALNNRILKFPVQSPLNKADGERPKSDAPNSTPSSRV